MNEPNAPAGAPRRRSNAERRAATRTALIAAARSLFVQQGYAATGTPEIVRQARVSRGALYHHFADKAALLRAVLDQEAAALADSIETAMLRSAGPLQALIAGSDAYFAAMRVPGRAILLLAEGPAALDTGKGGGVVPHSGAQPLADRIENLLLAGQQPPGTAAALTELLMAGYERAALAIAHGAPESGYRDAMRSLLRAAIVAPAGR